MSLDSKEMAFRRRMLEARLTVGTQEVYTRAIAELRKAGFTAMYSGLLGYFASVEAFRWPALHHKMRGYVFFTHKILINDILDEGRGAQRFTFVEQGKRGARRALDS